MCLTQPKRDASKYVGVRSWLIAYSETHADSNPMDGAMLLPAGHKYFYHNAMASAWVKLGDNLCDIPKLALFLEVWRVDLWSGVMVETARIEAAVALLTLE